MEDVAKEDVVKFVRRSDKYRYFSSSLINLIDVIFILLLFFMMTTTFNKFHHIDIVLPDSMAKLEKNENKDVELFYTLDENIIIKINEDEIKLTKDNLLNEIQKLSPEQRKNIIFNADKKIDYGKIINIISILKDADVLNIELNIENKIK